MSDALASINGFDRRLYGGDMRQLATLPADGIHPQTGERVYGTRAELGLMTRPAKTTFLRGDFIYIPEPEEPFAMNAWYDSGREDAPDDLSILLDKGWTFGLAVQWSLSDRMTLLGWLTDLSSGHIILPIVQPNMGIYPSKYHFMCCPWAVYQKQQAQMHADTDGVINEYQGNDPDAMTLIDDDPSEPQRIAPSLRSSRQPRVTLDDLGEGEE